MSFRSYSISISTGFFLLLNLTKLGKRIKMNGCIYISILVQFSASTKSPNFACIYFVFKHDNNLLLWWGDNSSSSGYTPIYFGQSKYFCQKTKLYPRVPLVKRNFLPWYIHTTESVKNECSMHFRFDFRSQQSTSCQHNRKHKSSFFRTEIMSDAI